MMPDTATRSDLNMIQDRLIVVAGGGKPGLISYLRAAGARDVLVLGGVPDPQAHWAPYRSSSRVTANNCTVGILRGTAGFALRSRRFFERLEYILLPAGFGWIAAGPGLLRYARRGHLKFEGFASMPGFAARVAVFQNRLFGVRPSARIYGPDRGGGAKTILKRLVDFRCVVLRWPEAIAANIHTGDLDILADHRDVPDIQNVLSSEAGVYPIDLYSDDGSLGKNFKSVSYFPPHMANIILATTQVGPSGFRVMSDRWRYVSFCYHFLFHKSHLFPTDVETLDRLEAAAGKYVSELRRLAREADYPIPSTVSDIENLLRAEEVFPEIDTIGFLSKGNGFLSARFDLQAGPGGHGRAVFLVRDFGPETPQLVDMVRTHIIAAGFSILRERPIDPKAEPEILRRIRGGNWSDRHALGHVAPPIHAFLCEDSAPLRPRRSTLRRYPRLDNERVLVKLDIRKTYGESTGLRRINIVHASDNGAEAASYESIVFSSENGRTGP